jgi:hypothetical protein
VSARVTTLFVLLGLGLAFYGPGRFDARARRYVWFVYARANVAAPPPSCESEGRHT